MNPKIPDPLDNKFVILDQSLSDLTDLIVIFLNNVLITCPKAKLETLLSNFSFMSKSPINHFHCLFPDFPVPK